MDFELFVQNNWWLIVAIMLWSLPWKGYALWTAAKRREKAWFIALLLVNTLALFEIFYLFVIAKKSRGRAERDDCPHCATE